ncbi:restriction endonuclease [Bordetella sp. 2513F-2]
MKLKPSRNSVFGILLRSSWWISAGIAALLILGTVAAAPREYWPVGIFAAIPFAAIALLAGWRQLRTPSSSRVEAVATAVAAMPWPAFSNTLASGFERDGCQVERLKGADADFALTKDGRIALVSAQRWKAARTGIDPVRRLQAAREARAAHEAIYIALGEISPSAQDYAAAHGISFMTAPELAKLLRHSKP